MKLNWQIYGFSWLPWFSRHKEPLDPCDLDYWLIDIFFGWLWFQFRVTYLKKLGKV